MKKIVLTISALAIGLLATKKTAAQQSAPEWNFFNWHTINNGYNFTGQPVASIGYNGNPTPTINTGTMVKSPNNTTLFSIFQGQLVDHNGNTVEDNDPTTAFGWQQLSYTVTQPLSNLRVDWEVSGYTENLPLPIPIGNGKVDCNRYYIFTAGSGFNRNWQYVEDSTYSFSVGNRIEPFFGVVNTSNLDAPYFETQGYRNDNGTNVKYTAAPLLDLIPGMFLPYYDGENTNSSERAAACLFAATPLRSDNTYFLFVLFDGYVYRYIVSSSGITYANTIMQIDPFDGQTWYPSEMEVCKLKNGDYRIAFPYGESATSDVKIKVFEVYGNGTSVGQLKAIPAPFDIALQSSGNRAMVHGLEFSPTGSYLYFTHETNSLCPNPIEYYSFSNSSVTPLLVAPTNKLNFATGFIEKNFEAGANNLYLTSSTEFVKLTNPDAPASSTWNVLLGPSNGFSNELGTLQDFYGNFLTYLSNMLPIYVDQMDYSLGFQTGECCLEYKANFNIRDALTLPVGTYTVSNGKVLTCTLTNNPSQTVPVTFSTITNVGENITVPPGSKYTFSGLTMEFSPNASLIVNNSAYGQQGGKVVLSNSRLTAYTGCDPNAMWPGVTLNGLDGYPQGSATNSHNAVLTTSGASQIDHAQVALFIEHGAIAQINGSGKLLNNIIAVEANDYNPTPSVLNDASVFSNCIIRTESNTNIAQPTYLVHLSHRQPAMRFLGLSTIIDNQCPAYKNKYDGIVSSDATITIQTPTIANLRNGVFHTNTNANGGYKARITGCTFTDNACGAYIGNSNYATVIRNHFNVLDNSSLIQWPLGLWLDGSSRFSLNHNTFNNTSLNVANVYNGSSSNWGGTTGSCIQNSNSADPDYVNIAEQGTYSKLHFGANNVGQNFCWTTFNPSNYKGLRYYCNSFTNNMAWYNMLVGSGTIDSHQGINDYAAQNQFYQSIPNNDLYVDQTQLPTPPSGYFPTHINYLQSGNGVYLPTTNSSYVTTMTITATSNDCSGTAVGSVGDRLASQTPSNMLQTINDLNQEYNAKTMEGDRDYLAYLDGELDKLKGEVVRYYLNDSTPGSQDSAARYIQLFALENNNYNQLFDVAVRNGDVVSATAALTKMRNSGASNNLISINQLILDNMGKDYVAELKNNPAILERLETIANDESDVYAMNKARWTINLIDPLKYRPVYVGKMPEGARVNSSAANIAGSEDYALSNFPNPFTGATTISATVPETAGSAVIVVNDVLGREIKRFTLNAGLNTVSFDDQNVSGVFIYTLILDGTKVSSKKMIKN